MFVLGHLGIGPRLLGPLRARLPAVWLALGCLAPDLLDKPLFYGLLLWNGAITAPIRGTRSFGHSLAVMLLLALAALWARRRWLSAVAAGVATHLALDLAGELFAGANPESSIWLALLWPLYGWSFPLARWTTPREHFQIAFESAWVVGGEVVGAALLAFGWISARRRQAS